jgi:hypothetical protein
MRMCNECGRPNGPNFARCMNCGAWIGAPSTAEGGPRSVEDAAQRARRLLDGLTAARAALLPAQFIESVQIQATGRVEEPLVDAITQPDIAPVAVPEASELEFPNDSERPSGPEWMPDEIGIELDDSVLGSRDPSLAEPDPEWPSVEAPPSMGAVDAPGWAPVLPIHRRQPPPPEVVDTPDDERFDDRTSAPGIAALDLHTGPDMFALPPGAAPLVEVLSRGRGPFGPRDEAMRLLLLPDPDYKGRSAQLKHRLKAVLDIDLYTGVLFLHRRIPTHLAASSDVAGLRRSATELRHAGLRVLLVDRDRWLDGALPRRIVALGGERPGPVQTRSLDGQELILERAEVEAAVFAEVPPDDDTGFQGFWILDLLLANDFAPVRLRSDDLDLSFLGDDAYAAPRVIARSLVAWLSEDPNRPAPLDENFRHVPASACSVRSPSADVHPIEGDFTEYVLLHDLGRRTA